MNATDAKIEAQRSLKRLAAEARLGGQYQSVTMAIHHAALKGRFETRIEFESKPHPGIHPALEDDGYDVAWDDDLVMDIAWR